MTGGTGGTELDRIRLVGLRARGHHGVLPTERAEGQDFLADVVLHLDTRRAGRTDDLADTVSYAEVAEDVVAVLRGEPVDLLEALAQRIADRVLERGRGRVRTVDVTVHKPGAPLTVPFTDVELTVRRHAAEAAEPEELADDAAIRTDEAQTLTDLPEAPAGIGSGTGAPDLDARPSEEQPVVLALGANEGDAVTTLRSAVAALRAADGLSVRTVSPLARTAPVLGEGQEPQPDYLNAVVLATTTLAPREVLALAQELEDAHGRARSERWGSRTLDVDVVAYGDVVADTPDLTLPHPRAHERVFVLKPWAQADPTAVLPGPAGGAVAELAARAQGRVRWMALDWLEDPRPTGAGA